MHKDSDTEGIKCIVKVSIFRHADVQLSYMMNICEIIKDQGIHLVVFLFRYISFVR